MTILESSDKKFYCAIELRENLGKYPNHPYRVVTRQRRPKAHYLTEKCVSSYVYRNEQEAIEGAKRFLDGVEHRLQRKAEAQAQKKLQNANVKASDFYKVGDVIVNTWGYDQTNVDWFQVVEVKPKTIVIEEIAGQIVEGTSGFMSCDVLPNEGKFVPDGKKYGLRVYANGKLSNPTSYYYMHKWSGNPQYCSWYH